MKPPIGNDACPRRFSPFQGRDLGAVTCIPTTLLSKRDTLSIGAQTRLQLAQTGAQLFLVLKPDL